MKFVVDKLPATCTVGMIVVVYRKEHRIILLVKIFPSRSLVFGYYRLGNSKVFRINFCHKLTTLCPANDLT